MRDHTKLRAFELADDLAVLVYRVTARFPREELYGLISSLHSLRVIEGTALSTKFIEAFGLLVQRGFISD